MSANNEKLDNAFKTLYELLGDLGQGMNSEVSCELALGVKDDSISKLTLFNKLLEKAYKDVFEIKKDLDELNKLFNTDFKIESVNKDDLVREDEIKEFKEIKVDMSDSLDEVHDLDEIKVNEANKDDLELPSIGDSLEEKNDSNDDGENKEEKDESKEEEKDSSKKENKSSSEETVDDNIKPYLFNKQNDDDPRVISVNEDQFDKLKGVKESNRTLLIAKKMLYKREGEIVSQEAKEESKPTDNEISKEEGEKRLEELSQKATDLYKEGKVQEAQVVMDEISEINNSLKKNK